MRSRPLGLGLLDQTLLLLKLVLRPGQLVARRYRGLVVDAVEDAEAEGGPSEDLMDLSARVFELRCVVGGGKLDTEKM